MTVRGSWCLWSTGADFSFNRTLTFPTISSHPLNYSHASPRYSFTKRTYISLAIHDFSHTLFKFDILPPLLWTHPSTVGTARWRRFRLWRWSLAKLNTASTFSIRACHSAFAGSAIWSSELLRATNIGKELTPHRVRCYGSCLGWSIRATLWSRFVTRCYQRLLLLTAEIY